MPTGVDPELLVIDGRGSVIPASRFLHHSASESDESITYDNAAIEIRTPKKSCHEYLNQDVASQMWDTIKYMRAAKLKGLIPMGSQLSFQPAGKLRQSDMREPSVQQFGCAPAMRVGADLIPIESRPLVDPMETRWRSAGYHVHSSPSGWSVNPVEHYLPRIAIADAMIGLLDVIMNDLAGWSAESRARRSVLGYGRAGEYRYRMVEYNQYSKSSVIEYRTMSPWPLSHPVWAWWLHSAVRQVMHHIRDSEVDRLLRGLPDRSEVIEAIDFPRPGLARRLYLEACRIWLDSVTSSDSGTNGFSSTNIRKLFYALHNGGHRAFYLDGWSLRRAWGRNDQPQSQSPIERAIRNRRQYIERHGEAWIRRNFPSLMPGNRSNTWPKGNIWHFPSGTTRYFEITNKSYPSELEL